MRTVPLGVNANDFPARDRTPARRQEPFTIGYLARIAPEKGLHNLAEAYRILRQERACRRRGCSRPATWPPSNSRISKASRDSLESWGLADEFEYRGAVDRETKVALPAGIDVLSVPSGYHEPKGLYLLEAMAAACRSCSRITARSRR